ncbi:S1-like domain-containing RNA-binding protein [Bacteriovoracaceae bacterium]|nr:S1-like domain-containing RNA-binding protein [Bacteriovoracaceae bacterium]
MLEIGKMNTLIVNRETDSGFYLIGIDHDEEAFLPPKLAGNTKLNIDDEIDVFVYIDNQDRTLATIKTPYAQVGEFAYLKAKEVVDFGAFLDWGIEKDLLIPANEQKIKIKKDEYHLVLIALEDGTDRIFATSKFGRDIEEMNVNIQVDEEVDILPIRETDLGFQVIINKHYIGLVYHNDIYSKITLGEYYKAYVKKIRDDNHIDVSFQKYGVKNLYSAKDKVWDYLEKNEGSSPLNDKSSPDEIKSKLGMSKKSFKSAIGMLYKEKKILIQKDGIKIVK